MLSWLSVKVFFMVIIVRLKLLVMSLIVMIITAVGMFIVIIGVTFIGNRFTVLSIFIINGITVFPFIVLISFNVVKLKVKGGQILMGFCKGPFLYYVRT